MVADEELCEGLVKRNVTDGRVEGAECDGEHSQKGDEDIRLQCQQQVSGIFHQPIKTDGNSTVEKEKNEP